MILHVDATGGIIRRAEYVKRQLFLFSAVVDSPNEDTSCVSISDCLMEECRTENAEFWLRRLRNDIARMQQVHLNHDHSVPAVVVVDFSWVLLHACASVFCGTTVLGLLKQTFEISTKPVPGNNRACSLFACSSHFMSRAARTLRKFFFAPRKIISPAGSSLYRRSYLCSEPQGRIPVVGLGSIPRSKFHYVYQQATKY